MALLGKGDATSNTPLNSFEVNVPSGVALHNDTVYIVDSGNKRVGVFPGNILDSTSGIGMRAHNRLRCVRHFSLFHDN